MSTNNAVSEAQFIASAIRRRLSSGSFIVYFDEWAAWGHDYYSTPSLTIHRMSSSSWRFGWTRNSDKAYFMLQGHKYVSDESFTYINANTPHGSMPAWTAVTKPVLKSRTASADVYEVLPFYRFQTQNHANQTVQFTFWLFS